MEQTETASNSIRCQGADTPSRERCLELLQDYGTPPHVIRHCIAVEETALRIAKALNDHGYELDLCLLGSAALLHDIARVHENHAVIGAEIVEDLGFAGIADLIRCHMTYSTDPSQNDITEKDILCLADRMVKENVYVGIEERMEYILAKFHDNPEARERITQRRDEIRHLSERIEATIGESIDALMT
jgi:uncharacterized protein